MAAASSIFAASEVGCDGVKPGGELAAVIAFAIAIDASKSFLGEVVGVVLVTDHAEEELKNRPGVAFHQGVQGRVMAVGKGLHVRAILLRGINCLHACVGGQAWLPWNSRIADGTQGSSAAFRSSNAFPARQASHG